MLKGTGVSAGVGIGRAVVLHSQQPDLSGVVFAGAQQEKERLSWAIQQVNCQLEQMTRQITGKVGVQTAEILAGQMMMLADPFLRSQIEEQIDRRHSAEEAVDGVCRNYIALFQSMEDELMRQRAADVQDLRIRMLNQLLGIPTVDLTHLPQASVLVAQELTPSMTVGMGREHIVGILTEAGGATSHSAILARALEIPAVLGIAQVTERIPEGALIAMDGELGHVYVNPDERTQKDYQRRRQLFEEQRQLLRQYRQLPTQDAEGNRIALYANIATPQEARTALEKGAEGIGLFRTEFLFMDRAAPPSEEEQLAAYRQVSSLFAGREVIIRTMDVGGDKAIECLHMAPEQNPFLGHRAIRYCLDEPDTYLVQLRALLRAGAQHKNIKLLLPLVTGVEEVRAAKTLLERAKKELAAQGLSFDGDMQVGVMIETPAASQIADLLAQEADFFSIGTNDLTQYTLAADRGNPQVAAMCTPFHPAVLRSIRQAILAARQAGIPVGMCGEAAANPALIPLLLAWGLDEFSVSASAVLATRRTISLWSRTEAREVAAEAMALSSVKGIQGYLSSMSKQ